MAKKTKKPVKATAKKKTNVHTPAAKVAAKPAKVVVPLSKIQPAGTPRTKSEILGVLAETTGLSKKAFPSAGNSWILIKHSPASHRGTSSARRLATGRIYLYLLAD